MVAVQNLKGEIIQLILSRKGRRGMYLVSATPTKLLIEKVVNPTTIQSPPRWPLISIMEYCVLL
jgi:hypothetical protein